MRWTALDQAYNFAKTNGDEVQLPHPALGQPAADVDGHAARRRAADRRSRSGSRRSPTRYPNIDVLQVVNEARWDPPDGTAPKNAGRELQLQRQLRAGARAAPTAPTARAGTGSSTPSGWRKQYFPNTKLMLNDVAITDLTAATDAVPEDHQHPQAREPDRRDRAAGARVRVQPGAPTTHDLGHPYVPGQHGGAQGQPRPPRRHRLPIEITELDIDGLAVERRRPATRCSCATTATSSRPSGSTPPCMGVTSGAGAQPNHWRNAQNAPIVLSNDTLKPAGAWLFDYVSGIAPVITAGPALHGRRRQREPVGTVQADDWASKMDRPELRTFTWSLTGGPARASSRSSRPRASCASPTRKLARREHDLLAEGARQRRLPRCAPRSTSPSSPASSRTSSRRRRAAPCPATLALTLGAPASFGAVHARASTATYDRDVDART